MGDKYSIDNSGNEVYAKSSKNSVIFIKINGDEIYAKTNISEEYYPDTGEIAKNRFGKPIYARMPDKSIIFKTNEAEDEIYLKDDEGNDHIENVYNIRYAKRKYNAEYYPQVKDEHGDFNETILQNSYAKDSTDNLFYPIDKMGHEVWHESAISTPNDYPITNDNTFLVPEKNGKPYFLNHLQPKLTDENIIGTIRRVDGSISYITNIECDYRQSRGAKIPYEIDYIKKEDDGNENKTINNPNLNGNGNDDDDNGNENKPIFIPNSNENGDDDDVVVVESDSSESSESDEEPMEIDETDDEKPPNNTTTTNNNNDSKKPSSKPSPTGGFSFDFYFIFISIITILLGLLAWYVKKRLLF